MDGLITRLRKAGWRYRRGRFVKTCRTRDYRTWLRSVNALHTVNGDSFHGAAAGRLLIRRVDARSIPVGWAVTYEIEAAREFILIDLEGVKPVAVYNSSDFGEVLGN